MWENRTTLGGLKYLEKRDEKVSGWDTGRSYWHGSAQEKANVLLSREYGISRWAVQCWLKEPVIPKMRGANLQKQCIYRHTKPATFWKQMK